MSSLARRIIALPGLKPPPARPAAAAAVPGPGGHPAHHVQVQPGHGAALTPLTSLVTSDGAMIPATSPGASDYLHPAGRIR